MKKSKLIIEKLVVKPLEVAVYSMDCLVSKGIQDTKHAIRNCNCWGGLRHNLVNFPEKVIESMDVPYNIAKTACRIVMAPVAGVIAWGETFINGIEELGK